MPYEEDALDVLDRYLTTRKPQKEIVYLREIDAGTDNACWVICNKIDPGAVAFTGYR